jgi:hypothetical protein
MVKCRNSRVKATISFAVYDVAEIVTEIEMTIARGVALTIVVETQESGRGKISFGIEALLTAAINAKACILKWLSVSLDLQSEEGACGWT